MSNSNLSKLLSLVSVSRRNQGGLLVLLTALGAVFEVVSLASVFPILAYILDPVSAMNGEVMKFIKPLTSYIPLSESYSIGILFAVIIMISSLYRIVLVWLQVSWGNAVGHDFSILVFSRLLEQSYEQHIVRNTSEVVAGITMKINQLVGSYINPLVAICSSFVLLIAIVSALVITAGLAVVAVVVLIGLVYTGITLSIRSKLAYNSQIISERSNSIVQEVQESFQGIREVILSDTGETRRNTFTAMDREFRLAQSSSAVLSQAPRYVVESLLVISLVGMALMQAGHLTLSGDLLPSLGVVVLGVQRIMPLAQVIYANVATMRGALCSVGDVIDMASVTNDRDTPIEVACKSIDFEKSLVLNQVSYSYPGTQTNQLKNITLSIKKGDWVGIYGKTGSGKSTLLDLICGLLSPTSGSILIDGVELGARNRSDWRDKLAVVSQSVYFSDSTILDSIVLAGESPDFERLNTCLKVAQLNSTIEGLEQGIHTSVGEAGVQFSGGQLQRLSIARALYREAEILIFDEATSALDQHTEKVLMGALRELNSELTVILVAHRLNTLEACNYLIQMESGEILSSSTYEQLILAEPADRRES
ncbi:ABC transporter ATP-binding protein/permease [Vibrio sp. S4M6]|uniref:ABC transporter ATP-binding protein n=1 Tax=Vibrio sinus TaxID=2946865 RepID=UPI002029BF13|nr:ABC transporter ATP-binding protein [Vibrio sinus]MCL9781550.1 ABC transporter ATP-binding protein/permease [Vibrio sinus]